MRIPVTTYAAADYRLFSGEEIIGWNEGAWLFPKVVRLLDIKQYRQSILKGLVLSASTKTDSTVSRPDLVFAQIFTRYSNVPYLPAWSTIHRIYPHET